MATPESFVEFYERGAEPVLLFFTRRTLDVEVSVDLTAETFAQAWRGWSGVRLDSDAEVQGWLFTIARRQLGHFLRRGEVERKALAQFGWSRRDLADDEIAEVERAAGLGAMRELLVVELHKLSKDQRTALQLRVVDELPFREVARRLGISEPNARARVSRGLRALAAALEPLASDERSTL